MLIMGWNEASLKPDLQPGRLSGSRLWHPSRFNRGCRSVRCRRRDSEKGPSPPQPAKRKASQCSCDGSQLSDESDSNPAPKKREPHELRDRNQQESHREEASEDFLAPSQ